MNIPRKLICSPVHCDSIRPTPGSTPQHDMPHVHARDLIRTSYFDYMTFRAQSTTQNLSVCGWPWTEAHRLKATHASERVPLRSRAMHIFSSLHPSTCSSVSMP